MDEHDGAEPRDDEVEAHLIKEAAVTAAAAGALFAGSAQARIIDPSPGDQAQQASLTQKASTKPAKKQHAKPHVRQRNRADTIDA